jgi:N-acetylglucosamine-6-sulfatase
MKVSHIFVAALVMLVSSCTGATGAARSRTEVVVAAAVTAPRPNFVVIVTDDQVIGTLAKMPHVKALLSHGTYFDQAIISNPLCCPSRATILTGMYSHTNRTYTNTDGGPTLGGYAAFHAAGNEPRTIAKQLDEAGYRTGLFGKYFNNFWPDDIERNGMPVGWDVWHGFTGSNPDYYDYSWVDWHKGDALDDSNFTDHNDANGNNVYSTDYAGRFADDFIDSAAAKGQPFFAYYAPFGPHAQFIPAPGDRQVTAPTNMGWKTPAYGETNMSDKPAYIRGVPASRFDVERAANFSARWDDTFGALRSVDRWVGEFVRSAPANTVFVFISDNGQTWGDHRFDYKLVPYERSIRVPFIVSAPGGSRQHSDSMVANADITPTILEFAGLNHTTDPGGTPYDGVSLVGIVTGAVVRNYPVHPLGILLEHISYPTKHDVPSYCGVRALGWMYVGYKGGFEELYNLTKDPYELHNTATSAPKPLDRFRRVAQSLCSPMPPGMSHDYFERKLA